jgi:Zn-dependent protease
MQPGSNWPEPVSAPAAESELAGYRAPIYGPASYGPPPHDPPEEPRPPSRFKRAVGPVGAAIVAFFAKLKAILLLLPKIKLLASTGTMFVSIAAYAVLWGWRFAVGFVALLLVHEMGHVIQLRREGVEASAPLFIAFLGAVVGARSLGEDAAAEARVGLAGPVLGTAGAAAVFAAAEASNSDFLRALAFVGFFLNLFNLVPVTPLDGGRAMAAMTPWMWLAGLFLIVGLAFAWPNPIIILIALVGAWDTWRRWKALRDGGEEARSYYRVSPRTRMLVLLVYLGLIAVCVLGMDLSHIQRTLSDV